MIGDKLVITDYHHAAATMILPAVREVLPAAGAREPALEGGEALHEELNRLSKRGCWDEMAGLVDDEMLETIAVVGPRHEIAAALERRLAGIADAVSLTNNRAPDPGLWADVVRGLRGSPTA